MSRLIWAALMAIVIGCGTSSPGEDCAVGSLGCECTAGGACDPGLACDTDDARCEQLGGCACDTDSACDATCSCDPDCAGVCTCDNSSACEAGCSCDADCDAPRPQGTCSAPIDGCWQTCIDNGTSTSSCANICAP